MWPSMMWFTVGTNMEKIMIIIQIGALDSAILISRLDPESFQEEIDF